MNTKKQSPAKQTPVHAIRRGETMASISLGQSNCGYVYFQFSLSRAWKSMSTGKEAHGNSFFDTNEEDLIQVIREASAWIRAKLQMNLNAQMPATQVEPEE